MPDQSETTSPALDVRGLGVRLEGSQILHGIDLRVKRGEVVAVLGTNGSGKSTLVRSLVRAVPVTEGTVEILGTPLGSSVPWDRVGYVPQRVGASAGVPATVAEIVASGLLTSRSLRKPRDWRARVDAALTEVRLAHRRDQAVTELSGGQQQRVLIARALVRDPELLILDEPVAGVDHPSQEALAATLRRLVASGRTIVVVLHELGELADLISRAVVLRHGRIVHDGAPPRAAHGHDAADHDHVHVHGDPEPRSLPPVLPEHLFSEGA